MIRAAQGGPDVGKTVHIVSSGLKAGATWHRVRILQDCRECCGGAPRAAVQSPQAGSTPQRGACGAC